MDITQFMVWNIDPELLSLGPITIRYYGVLFAAGLMLGYALWRWQMLRGNHNEEVTERWLVWAVVCVLVGSRLGHCLFYEPEIYLKDPIRILFIWRGGLASHGATIGLVIGLYLYARRYKFSFLEIVDRFVMSATMGALFVRLGNFMNSEIVGREWWGSLAVRFPRYTTINQSIMESRLGHKLGYAVQALPRHPSQLYEALGALLIFLAILGIDRIYGEKRPRGLFAGIFFAGYFTFRFLIEYVKEFQSLAGMKVEEQFIRILPTSGLTMGQWLSIPFALLGFGLIIYAYKSKLPACVPSPHDKPNKK